MKFKPVEKLPTKKAARHNLYEFIEEFVNSDCEIAEVDFEKGEYKTPDVCYSCIRVAVKRSKFLVEVHMRGNVVYLMKK